MLKTLAEQDKGLFDEDDTSDEELEPSHTDNYNGEANANQNLFQLEETLKMTKVKAAEQDKESLLTAIRLIYDDSKAKLPYGDQETNKIEGSNEANNAAFQTNYNKRKQPNINERISVTAETSSLRNNQYTVYCQPKNCMTPTK